MSELDSIALKIGQHILSTFNKWQKQPIGKSVVIPVQMPQRSDQPDWALNVEIHCPWFIEIYYENGERKHKHWTLNEYMGWDKKPGVLGFSNGTKETSSTKKT